MHPGDSSLRRSESVCGGVPYVFLPAAAAARWPAVTVGGGASKTAAIGVVSEQTYNIFNQ